jgi:hypothetical protein
MVNVHQSVVCNRLIIILVLPSLFSGIDKRMETWGKQGKIDPFKSIYDVCDPLHSGIFLLERI